ncbi:MAG: hypothetical protein ACLPWS_07730 [Rhodomicrobium sp.]
MAGGYTFTPSQNLSHRNSAASLLVLVRASAKKGQSRMDTPSPSKPEGKEGASLGGVPITQWPGPAELSTQTLSTSKTMPKGPKGEKRPADVIANAVKVMKIATGEIEEDIDTPEKEGKDPAAVSMGKRGGKARAEKMTPERRAEIAKKAATTRWKKN